MNLSTITALRSLGNAVLDLADSLVPNQTKAITITEHYSQQARDQRQWPVLALFAPLNPDSREVLPWEGPGGVKEVALNSGYTSAGVGGFFARGGLLAKNGNDITITEGGRLRFREIEARMMANA